MCNVTEGSYSRPTIACSLCYIFLCITILIIGLKFQGKVGTLQSISIY